MITRTAVQATKAVRAWAKSRGYSLRITTTPTRAEWITAAFRLNRSPVSNGPGTFDGEFTPAERRTAAAVVYPNTPLADVCIEKGERFEYGNVQMHRIAMLPAEWLRFLSEDLASQRNGDAHHGLTPVLAQA